MLFRLGCKFITQSPICWPVTLLATRTRFHTKTKVVTQQNKLPDVISKSGRLELADMPVQTRPPLSPKSPCLVPSRLNDGTFPSILKRVCSNDVDEPTLLTSHSTHDRHVTWGENQIRFTKGFGYPKVPSRQKHDRKLETYMKRRTVLQHIIVQDVDCYRDMLSSKPFLEDISEEEAVNLCTATIISHVAGAKTLSEVLIDCKLPSNAAKLYNAYHTLLAIEHIAFRDRLNMHMFFAKVEHRQEDRAYHADIIVEMIIRALEIPSGPKKKHHRVVDQAMEATYLQDYLLQAQEVLRADNEGCRLYVCWNRLAHGGEGQRLYMDNSACTGNLANVRTGSNWPMDVDDVDMCSSLAQNMARLCVEETEALLP